MYKNSIFDYNLNKTEENRRLMLNKRKDYKYYCRKYKNEYNRNLSNKMNDMRRSNPRKFWKMFKNKNIKPCGESIDILI